jgi:hypothetical protein
MDKLYRKYMLKMNSTEINENPNDFLITAMDRIYIYSSFSDLCKSVEETYNIWKNEIISQREMIHIY